MKKMMMMLAVALMSAASVNAQSPAELAKQQQELKAIHMKMLNSKPTKSAKVEAKKLEKDGWMVPAGELSIAQQITKSQLYDAEYTTDDNGETIKRFVQQPGNSTAGSYNAAYTAARVQAQNEVAATVRTQIVSAIKQKLDNTQSTAIAATTVDKFSQRAATIVDETLTNSIPVVAIYRILPNNNYQVQVRIAYDKKEMFARIKRNMQKELEREGDALNPIVEEVINSKL